MSKRSLVLMAASLCAGGLAVLAYLHETTLVCVRDYLDHPFGYAMLAIVLLAVAAAGLRWVWLRFLIVTFVLVGGTVVLFGGLLLLAAGAKTGGEYIDGPDPYRIRLRHSTVGLGPDRVTWLSVRTDA